jgi:hypothetical protein
MQAWLDFNFARARCDELIAAAARERLVRFQRRRSGGFARQRIARTLLALGSLLVAAGNRMRGDLAIDC